MTFLNTNDTAILIIDIQEKLLNAVFNKEIIAKNAEIIAKTSNILNIPVFITEQYPQGLGCTITSIKANLSDNTKFYEKTAFNALIDENLKNDLNETKIKNIIVLGIETHICVYQTVDALIDTGLNVTVINNACGSRSSFEYETALNLMQKNGATIKSTEMIIFELLKTAKHPDFKAIQALIK